jgi:Cd2+/Zn2+-exporting ATPase
MTSKILTLGLKNIDCAGCARTLERILHDTSGILNARINIIYHKVYLDYNPEKISKEAIFEIIKGQGYFPEDIQNVEEHQQSQESHRFRFLLQNFFSKKEVYTTLLSGLCFLSGIVLQFSFGLDLSSRILFIFGTIIGGLFIFWKSFFSIKSLNLDINVLMTIAAIAAIIIGEELEANSIVFLFSIAELAETFSVERAKHSIKGLIDYAPTEALMITNDQEQKILAEDVPVNSKIIVKPGERIPLDGKVIKGESFVNQAPITGESIPVLKSKGDEIFAGTLNKDGLLTVQTTKPYEEIFLKKIISLVESSDQRAPIERYVDTFAKYYTPVMFLVASLTLLIPPLITGDPFIKWVYVALIILVISCPCAVVLSTPITIVAALNRAARNGLLIKGGAYLESLSKTKVFAFDKTGTLTVGHPIVDDIIVNDNSSVEKILQISGSLEKNSNHPIAAAIKDKMQKEKLDFLAVKNFKSIAGKGIEGEINNEYWLLGNPRLITEKDLSITDRLTSAISIKQAEMKTVVIVSQGMTVQAVISVADQIKPHARGLVCELKALDAEKVIMLTGDNSKTAKQVANSVGIADYKAELLPDQKLETIEEMNKQYQNVAMIGDGVNDAPALAKANIGIAMGASGSDIALEAADVLLMTDSLDILHYLISLSRKSMRIIKQNIFIAIFIKVILFILSYFGLVELWMAVLIGDMGVSLFVIFNALLRARGKKMPHAFCDSELCRFYETNIVNKKKTARKVLDTGIEC